MTEPTFLRCGGHRPPLLLIMASLPSDVWWRVLPWLTPTSPHPLRQPGVGRTGRAPSRPIPSSGFGDALCVLGAAGFEHATVFGVSMGGTIAQELALRRPEVVDRLLLGCTTGGTDVVIDEEAMALVRSRGAMTPTRRRGGRGLRLRPGTSRADIDADLAVRAANPTDPAGYAARPKARSNGLDR